MLRVEQIAQQLPYPTEYFDFVVIGSGVSGIQAAEILAAEGKSVVVLQANDYVGGRIRTQRLIDLPEAAQFPWIRGNPKVHQCPIQHGATWLSYEHTFCLRWVKQLNLYTYLQYNDGVCVYGRKEGSYVHLDSLRDVYLQHKDQIMHVLNSVSGLLDNYHLLVNQLAKERDNPIHKKMFSQFVQLYDNLTVKTFLERFLTDKTLLQLVMHTIEVQECVPCQNLSMFNIINGDSAFENLKVYLGLEDVHTDSIKVREGMGKLIEGMLQTAEKHLKKSGLVRLSEPVVEIRNGSDHPEPLVITTKQHYRCTKVIWSVPVATSSSIKVTRMSESKRMFFGNQEFATAVKVFLIFKKAFWRTNFCGNAYFSEDFPFSQLCQVSPANLSCGVVAFFFCADKINQWQKKFLVEGIQKQSLQNAKKQYLLKTIADMFLQGNVESEELKDVVMAQRSFRNNKFIRSCYQSIPKRGVAAEIQKKFYDSMDCKTRDEFNIIFIGSEIGTDFGTYVEGAIRVTREKIYKCLGKTDPWLRNNH